MSVVTERYRAGINLGGWISQCRLEKEHIAGFITEGDIEKIAAWGLDHVRLPFDYPVLEDDAAPGEYLESGFEVIDRLVGWCKARSLNVVLDMHKAPGYDFGKKDELNKLFADPGYQKRFVSLWRRLAERYAGERDNVVFELINEVVNARGDAWNRVARMAVDAVREVDPKRYILLGGPNYNSVDCLKDLDVWDDDHMIYNFHFYEPFFFTHQRARWTYLRDTGVVQPYPGVIENPGVINKAIQADNPNAQPLPDDLRFDRAYVAGRLAPAVEFMKNTGKPLYCGEYGAIDLADMPSRINWMEDLAGLLNEYGIGRAYWTYKRMSFSAIDEGGAPISSRLVELIAL